MKKAGDRGSGSGVFTRDADAIIDLTELVLSAEEKEADPRPAYCVSGVLREFPSFDDFAVRFDYPIHVIDDTLDPARTEGSIEGNRTAGNNAQTKKKDERYQEFLNLLETRLKAGDSITQPQMAEQLGVSVKTISRYIFRANAPERKYAVDTGRGGCIRWADTV